MALTKVNRGGLNTGISDSSNATFLTVDSSEQAVIKSDGGAVTTSVQQGLAKAWVYFDATDTAAIKDSFNIASLTDSATGIFDSDLTNAMSNAFYSSPSGGHYYPISNPTSVGESHQTFDIDSNTIRSICGNTGAYQDWEGVHFGVFGDLA